MGTGGIWRVKERKYSERVLDYELPENNREKAGNGRLLKAEHFIDAQGKISIRLADCAFMIPKADEEGKTGGRSLEN